ncbi:MAG: SpoIIIAH-like family protein [Bacillota bacterium]
MMRGLVLLKRRVVFRLTALILLLALAAAAIEVVRIQQGRQGAGKVRPKPAVAVSTAPEVPGRIPEEPPDSPLDGFFVDYRLEREARRSQQVELLREIANAANTSEVTRKEAQEKLMFLSQQAEKEARTEGILRAKGFQEAIVAVEDEEVTVVVQGKVSPEQSATIVTLVYRGLSAPQEKVVIIEREQGQNQALKGN